MIKPINDLEKLITDICSLIGSRTDIIHITKQVTFPTFPEEPGAVEGDAELEKQTFTQETLHKTTLHLMEARKLLYTIGLRRLEDS